MGAGVYCASYMLLTSLLPPPSSPALRSLLTGLFLFLPGVLATAAAANAARRSRSPERDFWYLLAAAAAALTISQALFMVQAAMFPADSGLRAAAQLGNYAYSVGLVIALVVRPDRPRGPQEVRAAALEWLIALVGGYFLVLYFAILPRGEPGYPWFLVFTIQDFLPAVWVLVLALRVKEQPFRQVYRTLAVGLGGGALARLWPNWLLSQRAYQGYDPWDAGSVLVLIAVIAATRWPRGRAWVRTSSARTADRRRARLAVLAVAVPPLVDLATRAAGGPASLADQRSHLAVACSAVLSLLVAVRVHRATRPAPHRDSLEAWEARRPLGEPTEYLQFASGVAHELNNPLTAVAGWAELARGEGMPEKPVAELLEATRAAAQIVNRLQRISRGSMENQP